MIDMRTFIYIYRRYGSCISYQYDKSITESGSVYIVHYIQCPELLHLDFNCL